MDEQITETEAPEAPVLDDATRAKRLADLQALIDLMRPAVQADGGDLVLVNANVDTGVVEVELAGGDGLVYDDWTMHRPQASNFFGRGPGFRYLRARGNSIEGGTSEILRNIIAERVLGLPQEPRVDKDVPWKDLPR